MFSTEGLIAAIILLVVAVAWVGSPLLQKADRAADDSAAEKRQERLLVYYERVMTNLRDLDEDHATGKIADAEYQTERETWVQRGIQALKALDALNADAPVPASADEAVIDREIDDSIEAAIAAYRHQ